jgi:hypothetical protein
MNTCTVTLHSTSPYSQGKHVTEETKDRELKKDYEARTWRHRLHVNEAGNVIIPPMSFKNCLSEAAKFLSLQIPGKGKATYTKHFEAGVMVTDPMVLDIKAADVSGEWLFVPSDGKRGGGTRVDRCFPKIESWSGKVTFYILDPIIGKEVFEKVLTEAGKFIGIGRFRPACNGYYGRFKPVAFGWQDDEEIKAAA